MKTLNISFFCFCLAFLFPYYASGQSSFLKHYETKEALESDASKIITDFDLFVKDQGYNL